MRLHFYSCIIHVVPRTKCLLTFVGMMVVCIMFLNLPMEGSTSSGLMISSSSENTTELAWLLRFRGLSTSVIPTMEICLL